MNNKSYFYCYSLKLYHFLCAFGEKCYASKINSVSKTRYWIIKKSERVDKIIALYNEVKHTI